MRFKDFKQPQEKKEDNQGNVGGLIPPQYEGLDSSLLEEIWVIPVYIDEDKTRKEQEKKELALKWLREKENNKKNVDTHEEMGIEDCMKLKNIQIGKKTLEKLLTEGANKEKMAKALRKTLTTRSSFAEIEEDLEGNLVEFVQLHKDDKAEYDRFKGDVIDSIKKTDNFNWSSNPGWLGIDTVPEAERLDDVNSMKIYTTLSVDESSFVKHVLNLAEKLRKISLETDDQIKIKFPESFTGFMAHSDSLVVHFKNKNNIDSIQNALNQWMKDFQIKEDPREMGRTKVAADSKNGKSFTQLVSSNIANWLEENKNKYSNKLLAELAIKYAIRQSQKTPDVQ